jgi:hypothetical protein
VTAWAEEAGGLPPIPLDDNGLIDLNMLEVLIGTTNADGVGVYFEPGGEELAVIPNTGTLVCVYAADDPLSPGWYQAAFESGDYVYSGYIESGTLAVAPVTDAENLLGSGAYALALNKMYDMSQPLPEQFPEGLYEAILAARPVYLSRTGSKYHYNPTCSNMRSPRETTLSSAVAAEKEPCSRCVKDNGSV